MQIKAADSRQADILALQRLLDRDLPGTARKRIDAQIRQIQAGEKAERDAGYQIELYFGRSENWATIHDLRIEVDGLVTQIDHLLINRLAEVWVCESKSFGAGVSINEHGEWLRWWRGRPEGMQSPIEQNRRHIHLLQRVFADGLAPLPRRLGLAPMKPRFRSLVLVSDSARINRPKGKVDGIDEVIKAEQLKTRLMDEFDKLSTLNLARVIGKEQLVQFSSGLAALHRPSSTDWEAKFGLDKQQRGQVSSKPDGRTARRPWVVKYDGPCSGCGRSLQAGTEAAWSTGARKMYCLDCAAEDPIGK